MQAAVQIPLGSQRIFLLWYSLVMEFDPTSLAKAFLTEGGLRERFGNHGPDYAVRLKAGGIGLVPGV